MLFSTEEMERSSSACFHQPRLFYGWGGERVRLVLSPPTGVFNVNHRIRAVSPERCEKIWFRFDGHRQRARMTRLLPVALQHSYSDWQTRPSAILMLQAELVGNGNLAI